MSHFTQLKEQIQARKFEAMELEVKISNLAEGIRNMIGTRLTLNKQIPFDAIAGRASEAFMLTKRRIRLQEEIRSAEEELEG